MRALLVIDMLRDFVEEDGPLPVPAARGIVKAINKEIRGARERKEPVIFVCDSHRKDDEEFRLYPPHCITGTKGAEVVDELEMHKGDKIVKKTRFSAFYRTRLTRLLRARRIDALTLTGVLTDICVMYTAGDATMRGYRVRVPKGCVASLSDERHEGALRHMKEVLGVEVV
jgi:nicotinamidase-related amidase